MNDFEVITFEELNKLRKQNEIMREALESIAFSHVDLHTVDKLRCGGWTETMVNDTLLAREALKKVHELK